LSDIERRDNANPESENKNTVIENAESEPESENTENVNAKPESENTVIENVTCRVELLRAEKTVPNDAENEEGIMEHWCGSFWSSQCKFIGWSYVRGGLIATIPKKLPDVETAHLIPVTIRYSGVYGFGKHRQVSFDYKPSSDPALSSGGGLQVGVVMSTKLKPFRTALVQRAPRGQQELLSLSLNTTTVSSMVSMYRSAPETGARLCSIAFVKFGKLKEFGSPNKTPGFAKPVIF